MTRRGGKRKKVLDRPELVQRVCRAVGLAAPSGRPYLTRNELMQVLACLEDR